MIRFGKKLKVPGEDVAASRSKRSIRKHYARKTQRTYRGKDRSKVHIVRRGDTLYGISKHYGVPLANLQRSNQLRQRSKLYVGAKILIPD